MTYIVGSPRSRCFLLIGILLAIATCSDSAVHKYQGYFFQTGDAWLFRGAREGLYASTKNAVAHWSTVGKGIANGKSYLRFDQLKFTRTPTEAAFHDGSSKSEETGLVQALVFDVRDRERIGSKGSNGGRHFCCSPELVSRIGCTVGRLIVSAKEADPSWPRVIDIPFYGNSTEALSGPTEVPITRSGMYYLWFVICDKTLVDVSVSGATVWKNPGGYLPGMMYPFLNFLAIMSLAYILLGLVWFVQYTRYWRDTFQLQNNITAVLLLSCAEMAVWYFDYVNFNATGFRPYAITVWAVLLSAARKTVSRLLVLIVSMGYGVVRPSLGGLSAKVLSLGAGYFAAALCLDMVQNVGAINDLTSAERMLLVLPVAVLDAIFILWIFNSLSKTVAQLQVKKNVHKLGLYSKFTNTLAVTVLVSIGWIGYEMYTKAADQFNEEWEKDWVTTAFWHVLTYLLLLAICVLWAPSKSATRYAFDADNENDEEENIPLTTVAVNSAPAPSNSVGTSSTKVQVNTDVFQIDDDAIEEGKLE